MSESTDTAKQPAPPPRRGRLGPFLLGLALGVAGLLVVQFAWDQWPRDANTIRDFRPGDLDPTHPAAEIPGVDTARPHTRQWAEPINRPGLPNLHKVSNDLYRGARPDEDDGGYDELRKLGIRTVINLQSFHRESEKVSDAGIPGYRHIYSKTWNLEDEDVIKFLQTLHGDGPFFVHCYHGSDRTGLMCAVYRVVVQGWSKDEAVAEMTRGGFGFHRNFDELVHYVYEMDVEDLKRRSGWDDAPAEP